MDGSHIYLWLRVCVAIGPWMGERMCAATGGIETNLRTPQVSAAPGSQRGSADRYVRNSEHDRAATYRVVRVGLTMSALCETPGCNCVPTRLRASAPAPTAAESMKPVAVSYNELSRTGTTETAYPANSDARCPFSTWNHRSTVRGSKLRRFSELLTPVARESAGLPLRISRPAHAASP